MAKRTDACVVVLVTFKNTAEAKRITTVLLRKRLIACCNLVERVESFFWWERKIHREHETLAIIKTKRLKFDSVIREVKARHSYHVPEIIALPVLKGNPAYLEWIRQTVI
jgi:periplasmic divalent cation tolerance protein